MESASEIASRLDLVDVFALRRVSDEQLVNLAGVGRGEGWAGNISIDAQREPLVARAMDARELVRHSGECVRIFGPYWTPDAAIVQVGDFVVVMGGDGVPAHSDDELIEAAGDLAWSVGDVSAEKRLADELEVTQVALSVASLPTKTIDEFLARLADTAIASLSCEFGAVVVERPERRVIVAPSGWQPEAPVDLVLDSLSHLLAQVEADNPMVAQDLRNDPAARSPLAFEEGLVSRCLVPLAGPGFSGAIVVAHMVDAPRGFTSLCQQVATSIGAQANRVLDSNLGSTWETVTTTGSVAP